MSTQSTLSGSGPEPTADGASTGEASTGEASAGKASTATAEGYRPGRTLPLRVEFVRQLKRGRTLAMGAVLTLLPVVMAVAFAIGGDDGDGPGRRINLMDTATASGANFAATCLFVSASLLLVVPVALFCGDTVASEANWSSLRYLLAAPVPRMRLLWSKLAVGLTMSLAAMVWLPLVALAVGSVAYGWGPLRIPTGGALPLADALWRLAVVVGYLFVSQLVTAALAFWLSTRTDAPLGAVGGAVGLTIAGSVLDQVEALGAWRQFLPAHWQFAWADAIQPQVVWDGMLQGMSVSVAYALVLFALAFRGFARKDVVS